MRHRPVGEFPHSGIVRTGLPVTQLQSPDLAVADAINGAADRDSFQRVCWNEATKAGVSHCTVRLFRTDDAKPVGISALVETLPIELTLERLKLRHANYLPLMVELCRGDQAFSCDNPPANEYRQDYLNIWDEYRQIVGCTYHYTVPVYDQNIMRGVAIYLGDRKLDQPDVLRALDTVTIAGYEKMVQLSIISPALNPLTNRQRDVLSYCAIGKSDWEIGELLGISSATAHEHIEAAKRRLGVRTRVQAVVVAMQRGWINT